MTLWDFYFFFFLSLVFENSAHIFSRELLLGDLDFTLDNKAGYLTLAQLIRALHSAHHRDGCMTGKRRC